MNNTPKWSLILSMTVITLAAVVLLIVLGAGQGVYASPSATLIVTSTADSGPGTLRQAIADANPGDTIEFSLIYPAVITLTSAQLDITRELTIAGPGAANLTVNGNNGFRVFYITSTVAISGMTIADGSVPRYGGGIFNSGNLTLDNVAVTNNVVTYVINDNSGGGIYNSGTLLLSNSGVVSNAAPWNGGGLFNVGTMTVNHTTVAGNLTVWGDGGGIYNGGTLLVNHSTVMSNTTRYFSGGGLCNDGTATLNNITVVSNTAYMVGGGILNDWDSTLVVNNSTIGRNSVSGDSASGSRGGGIYNASAAVTLNGTTVMSNTADSGGGIYSEYHGSVTLNNCTVSGNVAAGGGAIAEKDARTSLRITQSTVADNTATSDQATSGIWLIYGGDITLTNSIVANNGVTNNFKMYQGNWSSLGYNLSNDWNGLPLHTSDKTGDPVLGPLEDNGGETWTHALSINSLAVDQVPHGVNGCGTLHTQDQRGEPRPYQPGGRCDSGAFEARDLIWYVYALMSKDELP